MSLCNATKQELTGAGLNILMNCTVEGCGLPVARHRDENAPLAEGILFFSDVAFCSSL